MTQSIKVTMVFIIAAFCANALHCVAQEKAFNVSVVNHTDGGIIIAPNGFLKDAVVIRAHYTRLFTFAEIEPSYANFVTIMPLKDLSKMTECKIIDLRFDEEMAAYDLELETDEQGNIDIRSIMMMHHC